MKTDAILSECKTYRYVLSRTWDESKGYALFIGLNPSTADGEKDDPTINRCIDYAKSWGYGGIKVVNLFAYRATLPSDLKQASNPIGPENDKFIRKFQKDAEVIIAAWGDDGVFKDRYKEILKLTPSLKCLKINKSGQPAHPLYQNKSLQPIPYQASKGNKTYKLVLNTVVVTIFTLSMSVYLNFSSILNSLEYVPSAQLTKAYTSLKKSNDKLIKLKGSNKAIRASLATKTKALLVSKQALSVSTATNAKLKKSNKKAINEALAVVAATKTRLQNNVIKKASKRAGTIFTQSLIPVGIGAATAATTVIAFTANEYCENQNNLDNISLALQGRSEKEMGLKKCADVVTSDVSTVAKKYGVDFVRWGNSKINETSKYMTDKVNTFKKWAWDTDNEH